jgi:hypothetical protein
MKPRGSQWNTWLRAHSFFISCFRISFLWFCSILAEYCRLRSIHLIFLELFFELQIFIWSPKSTFSIKFQSKIQNIACWYQFKWSRNKKVDNYIYLDSDQKKDIFKAQIEVIGPIHLRILNFCLKLGYFSDVKWLQESWIISQTYESPCTCHSDYDMWRQPITIARATGQANA